MFTEMGFSRFFADCFRVYSLRKCFEMEQDGATVYDYRWVDHFDEGS